MNETTLKVLKPTTIEDGIHQGLITDVTLRKVINETYEYIDVHIQLDDSKTILKASYPANMMIQSKLGQLVSRFGAELQEDKDIDVSLIKGERCSFITLIKGKFANVVIDSVKPIA